MPTTIATWNINSVRLRQDLVADFLMKAAPDVLCLQETKSPVEKIPAERFADMGYQTITAKGFKGYNGVMILSRVDAKEVPAMEMCGKDDARHCAIKVGGATVHNFYVPAGGDEPDRKKNPKFDHKLNFVDEMTEWSKGLKGKHILVGDLNIAPLEEDVWSHKQLLKVVSHTPVETEAMGVLMKAGKWVDTTRADIPVPEKVYSWWSYRARDWAAADKGRRLDHIWYRGNVTPVAGSSKILKDFRGAEKPSDHAPVLATFDF